MSSNDVALRLDEVTDLLSSASIKDTCKVSFADQHLKLDSEKEASGIVAAIEECGPQLECLCLEGNTLGQAAARAIGKALEKCPSLKRALWKDLFTGRLKNEIPDALRSLSSGILLSGAQLVEIDLSDNALGPVGSQGLLTLFGSRACWCLESLKLNNNGLGPEGSQTLFAALGKAVRESKEDSLHPSMPLKTLVCGRNRLENAGAAALGELLKELGTLEELCLPQNGIFKDGIRALCQGLRHNERLRVLNLNDNILTPAGAHSLAQALQHLERLEVLNLGDCLIKNAGALAIANVLKDGHPQLRELYLGYNEVSTAGGVALAECVLDKEFLEVLELDGNCFGAQGIAQLEALMESAGKSDTLGAFSDDEGSEDGDDEEEEESGGTDDEDDDDSEHAKNEALWKEGNSTHVAQTQDGSKNSSPVRSSRKSGPPLGSCEETVER